MTTEDGIPKMSTIRKRIELLRERMEYLCDKQAQRIDDGARVSRYVDAEITALEWALPILEAEWDNMIRLRRIIMRTEGRSEHQIADHERQWNELRNQ